MLGVLPEPAAPPEPIVTGNVSTKPMRNNHFIMVTVLYFSDRGLTTMINDEKKIELIIKKMLIKY